MPSVAEIRVLSRGFRVLEAANLNNGARLRDFVQMTGLPKTTTFRILENLRAAGYLSRDDDDDRYYLTVQVRRLSDGFNDAGWITDVARPLLESLSSAVGFPVAIATPYGASMMLRANTDARSPLPLNVYTPGIILPLLTSATGKVFLAFCDDITRQTLLDVCARSDKPEHRMARHPQLVEQTLKQVRRQGYAFGRGAGKTPVTISTATFSVPIRASGRLIGCLALRYLSDSLSRETVAGRYLEIMIDYAGRIGSAIQGAARPGRPADTR